MFIAQFAKYPLLHWFNGRRWACPDGEKRHCLSEFRARKTGSPLEEPLPVRLQSRLLRYSCKIAGCGEGGRCANKRLG
jgi:hypothetical protein